MMYTLKGRYAVVTFLLCTFTLSQGGLFKQTQQQQQQRYNPAVQPLPWHSTPPWEYILREIILKSVTPSPPAAVAPYKRPLDASFYGGPIAVYSSDDENVVLSRGNIYHLLNGHWMLCQEGCVDCEPCTTQRNPLFKWVLRRIRQLPVTDPPRHDLQLTIMPQVDDRLYASNLWPNSYVYVTSQEDTPSSVIKKEQYDKNQDYVPGLESSFSAQHHRSKDLRQLTERDSTASRDGNPQRDDRVISSENASIEKIRRGDSPEQKHNHGSTRRRRPRPKPSTIVHGSADVTESDGEETVNQLAPRLILGTDQEGQRHLIHVIPADYPPPIPLPVNSLISNRSPSSQSDQETHSNKIIPKRGKQTYEQLFHRIIDSLNTHRRPIELFLETLADNVGGQEISVPADNIEVAGFPWKDRETRRAKIDSETTRFNEAPSLSLYVEDSNRKNQQYGSGHNYENMNQGFDNYYLGYLNANPAKISRNQELIDSSSVRREGRETYIKPYSVNNTRQNIPAIDLSILLQSLDNSSTDAIPRPGPSGFVMNSVKQIDLNDTSVDKAFVSANDSIEPSSITTDRENRQLFNLERLKSGDANREVRASHHPFRIIVTTESSAMRREHETPNRIKKVTNN